jgi:thiol-disulfide isomerase/thioredoxin
LQNDTITLSLLVGVNNLNQLVSIADANGNNSFTDDSLYTYAIAKADISSLPRIYIPNVTLKDKYGRIKRYKLEISFTPNIFTDNLGIKDISLVKENIQIHFYPLNYYGADIWIDKELFEIALIPFPLAFDYFDLDGTYKPSFCSLRIYKKLRSPQQDSSVYTAGLRPLIDKKGKYYQMPIPVNKHTLVINNFSFESKTMQISIGDSVQKKDGNFIEVIKNANHGADVYTMFSLTQNKFRAITPFIKYTLIEFSGSWCKPCKIALPGLKKLYEEFQQKVDFITIAKENDLATAKSYYKESAINWEMVYEKLNCFGDTCLTSQLNIAAYPSFLLVDNRGNILFNQSGTNALEALRVKLEELK